MPQAQSHSTEFYVLFDAQIYGSSAPYVRKIRAVRLTKTKPGLAGGEIALKFKATVPDAAFLRLIPDVDVVIPDGFWTSQPIEVMVADPDQAEATQ